jgi:ADP-L-glycero-D-manno-heptose 6-epimerase
MRKVLITGTKGFIGKQLLNELKSKFLISEINENIFDLTGWHEELYTKLMEFHPDVIFHIGACSNTLETNVNYMMTRNFESTKIISDYCSEHDIPLIYSSSAANYGTNGLYPSNLYGWSKYMGEQYVIQNGGIALRYFNVYGPGEEYKGKMSSVAYQMYVKFNNNENIKLFPLQPRRDFIYIKDVIDANLFAYNNYEDLRFSYYDVGYGETRTFEDVMTIMGIPFTYTDKEDIPKGYQFLTLSDKQKWMTDWYPKYNLEIGLTEYKEYLNKKTLS